MTKKKIDLGHTNQTYIENNKLIIIKHKNSFNHNLNYQVTQQFHFVPKLLKDDAQQVVWQYVPNSHILRNFNNDTLTKIAKIIHQIHNSKIMLPKNNLRQRAHHYLAVINRKKLKIPEINDNFREMMNLLKSMRRNFPCHNDVWPNNLLQDQNHQIWLVDWEYATMGDPYFDLAYFITSSQLNHEQETIFLQHYLSLNSKWEFSPHVLHKYKRFANWLTLCWAYSQVDGPPFDVENVKNFLNHN